MECHVPFVKHFQSGSSRMNPTDIFRTDKTWAFSKPHYSNHVYLSLWPITHKWVEKWEQTNPRRRKISTLRNRPRASIFFALHVRLLSLHLIDTCIIPKLFHAIQDTGDCQWHNQKKFITPTKFFNVLNFTSMNFPTTSSRKATEKP